jgi:hypothetical protein
MSTVDQETTTPTPVGRVLGVSLGLVLLIGTLMVAFALPAVNSEPNEVPIAVAGPGPAAEQLAGQLESNRPGAFDVSTAADVDEIRDRIADREIYGALAMTPEGVTVYTATAASPAVARILTEVGNAAAAGAGVQAVVEGLAPLPEDDPNGTGLAASALPLAAGGLIIAALAFTAVRGTSRQALVGLIAPPAVAAALAAVLVSWFGTFDGGYANVFAALTLVLYATAWAILGLAKLLGRAGLILGAVVIMLLGNPLSGLNSAPELLPAGWGAFGQLLPPGAGGTALRSAGFFDWAGSNAAVWVLASWLAAGIVLFALGTVRDRAKAVSAPAEAVPA